jgi:hypothetical protein
LTRHRRPARLAARALWLTGLCALALATSAVAADAAAPANASTAGPVGTQAASDNSDSTDSSSPEPSQAERLLFMQAHLATVKPPLDLVYDVVHDDNSDPAQSYTDTVTIKLSGDTKGGCCAVAGEFLSGARAMRLPDIGNASANPLLLYFLEFEVRRLQASSKGQAAHFRRRIRLALVDAAKVKQIEFDRAGRHVQAHEITVSPFVTDPYRVRFEQEATRQYRFVIADDLPGQFAEIDVIQTGAGATPRRSTTRITLR